MMVTKAGKTHFVSPEDKTIAETRGELEAPLNPELTYFDATPTIEQLFELIEGLQAKIQGIEGLLGLQGGINAKLMGALQELKEQDTGPKSGLILPGRLNS